MGMGMGHGWLSDHSLQSPRAHEITHLGLIGGVAHRQPGSSDFGFLITVLPSTGFGRGVWTTGSDRNRDANANVYESFRERKEDLQTVCCGASHCDEGNQLLRLMTAL